MYSRIFFFALFAGCLVVSLLNNASAASKSTERFIQMATSGNQFELSTSQLALTNSENDDVKKFAQQMVNDHTKVGSAMKAVLTSERMDIPDIQQGLNPKQQSTLDRLGNITGPDFDKAYIDAQIGAHGDAVSLFSDYSQNGDDIKLKNFASTTLPTLKEHQAHIKQIQSSYQ